MRVAVVGSRSFNDYDMLAGILSKLDISVIVTGGARGADKLAEQYAKENGIEIAVHLPDWEKFGRSAGFIRNADIIKDCDAVIAFWDGVSPGTKNTIGRCRKANKPIEIIMYNEDN